MTCPVIAALVLAAGGCQGSRAMKVTHEDWGEHDGKTVQLYTLDNGRGMVARISASARFSPPRM